MAAATAYGYSKSYIVVIILALIGLWQLAEGFRKMQPDCSADPSSAAPTALPKRNALIMLGWLVLSIASVSVGGRVFSVYLYLLAPVIAILAAVPFARPLRTRHSLNLMLRAAAILLFVVGIGQPLYLYQSGYFDAWRDFLKAAGSQTIHFSNMLTVPSAEVSKYIQKNTAETDHVFIWGYHPHIAVASGRHFATRFYSVALQTGFVWGTVEQLSGWVYPDENFYWTYPRMNEYVFKPSDTRQWIYPGSQELLLKDLNAKPPELFIDANVKGEFPFGDKYPIALFPRFREFVDRNYRLEKCILGYKVYRLIRQDAHWKMTFPVSRSPFPVGFAGKCLGLGFNRESEIGNRQFVFMRYPAPQEGA